MAISSPIPRAKDVVIYQRSDDNTFYGEAHISGSKLIFHIDSTGHINADDSASFYTLYPPISVAPGPTGTTLYTASTYEITSSWAISASWAPPLPSDYSISSSWASSSLSSSITERAITASFADTSSWTISASWAPVLPSDYSTSASWASSSLSASWAELTQHTFNATSASWASHSFTSTTASFASHSFTASYSYTTSIAVEAITSNFSNQSAVAISSSWSSHSFNAETASYATNVNLNVISTSWASSSLSASWIDPAIGYVILYTGSTYPITTSFAQSASAALWAETASYVVGGGGGGVAQSRMVVLCSGITPSDTGPDVSEIPMPYGPDGTSTVTWSFKRFNFRVGISGSLSSSVSFEKSTTGSAFSASLLATLTMPAFSHEVFTGSNMTINSGEKLRYNVLYLGDAEYWTLTTEIVSS